MSDTRLSVIAELKIQGFQKNLDKMQSSLNRFQNSGLTKAAAGLAKVSAAFTAMGLVAVKAAADVETLETSLVSLVGGTQKAAQAMQNLNEFTAKTPFQLEGVAKAFRQLVAAGSSTDEATNQLQFLGDIAATTGARIEDIAAIFAKVNAKGKVELENLNQLAERGIPVFKALSEATGLPASELGAGAVSVAQFNKVLASFAEAGGFAEGAMERLSETTAGKLSTAMDNVKLAVAEVGETLKPLADALLEATIAAAGFVRENPKLAATLGKLIGLTAALTGLAALVTAAVSAFAVFGTTLLTVGLPIAALVTSIGLLALSIYNIVDASKAYKSAQDRIEGATKSGAEASARAVRQNDRLRASVALLKAEYENSNTTEDRKLEILQELRGKHDSLKTAIDNSKDGTVDLTEATRKLNDELERSAEAAGRNAAIRGLEASIKDIETRTDAALKNFLDKVEGQDLKVDYSKLFDPSGTINEGEFQRIVDQLWDVEWVDALDLAGLRKVYNQMVEEGSVTISELLSEIDRLSRGSGTAAGDKLSDLFDALGSADSPMAAATALKAVLAAIDKQVKAGDLTAEKSQKARTRALETYTRSAQKFHQDELDSLQSLFANGIIQEEEYLRRRVTENKRYTDENERAYRVMFDQIKAIRENSNSTEAEIAYASIVENFILPGLVAANKKAFDQIKDDRKVLGEVDITPTTETNVEAQTARARIEALKEEKEAALDLAAAREYLSGKYGADVTPIPSQAQADSYLEKSLSLMQEIFAVTLRINEMDGLLVPDVGFEETLQSLKDLRQALKLSNAEAQTAASILSFDAAFSSFQKGIDLFKSGSISLSDLANKGDELQKEFDRITARKATLEDFTTGALAELLDPQLLDYFTADLAALERGLKSVEVEFGKAGDSIADFFNRAVDIDYENILQTGNIISESNADLLRADAVLSQYQNTLADTIKLSNDQNTSDLVQDQANAWIEANYTLEEYLKNQVALNHMSQEFADSIAALTPKAREYDATVSQFAANLANFVSNSINQLIDGTKDFGQIMGDVIKQLLIKLAALAVAFAIIAALNPLGTTATKGFGAFVSAGFGLPTGVPKFAEGGAVFGPTLALIGEKPGSRGEAVVPFEKIGQFVDMVGGGRSEGPVEVYGKLKGRDIELSGRRGGVDRSRRY